MSIAYRCDKCSRETLVYQVEIAGNIVGSNSPAQYVPSMKFHLCEDCKGNLKNWLEIGIGGITGAQGPIGQR